MTVHRLTCPVCGKKAPVVWDRRLKRWVFAPHQRFPVSRPCSGVVV